MNTTAAIVEVRRTYAAFLAAAENLNAVLVGDTEASPLLRTIMCAVADHYGVHVRQLTDRTRTVNMVGPRHMAMAMCCECTEAGVAEVGRAFRRTHTAVTHARTAIQNRCDTDPSFATEFTRVQSLVVQAIQTFHPHA